MKLNTPGLAVEVALSSLNWNQLGWSGEPSWNGPLETFVPYLETTGFRNVEVWPSSQIVQEAAERTKRGDTEIVRQVVGSAHQVAFQDGDMFGAFFLDHGLQSSIRSVGGMQVIQAALGRPVSTVHYIPAEGSMIRLPVHQINIDPAYPGSFPVVQPDAEIYGRCGSDEEWLYEHVIARGAVGYCLDTVHARNRTKEHSAPPSWEDVLPKQLAQGRVYQVHFGLDRLDVGIHGDLSMALKSHREFVAFNSRRPQRAQNTEAGEMLIAAIENYVPPAPLLQAVGRPVLRVVVEMMPGLRPQDWQNRTAQHARVLANIVEIIKQTGATPLLYGNKLVKLAASGEAS